MENTMNFWNDDEFTEQLRAVGRGKYHDKHPFHRLMNEGKLSREQLQLWVANRFYYQKNIPIKDAILLSRCPDRDVRRQWVQRIIDHDGAPDHPGGIEKWLRLGEATGLNRADLEGEKILLPAVRYAVDAYVNFVRERPWIEGIASSLTELFAPDLMAKRLAAFERHYTWIDPSALEYFRSRLTQAPRDSDHGLSVVLKFCRTREEQNRAVAALSFKCDLLWAQLDALYYYCVAPTQNPSHSQKCGNWLAGDPGCASARACPANFRPLLVPHARYRWDEIRKQHQIVYPESVLELNATGAEIVRLCDGRTMEELIGTLKNKFGEDSVEADVRLFVGELVRKGLVRDESRAQDRA